MKRCDKSAEAARAARFGTRFAAPLIAALVCSLPAMPAGLAVPPIPDFDRVRVLEPAREITDVALIDHNGRPFVLSQLRGRVALVFLGFTNCPDVCPMALQRMKQFERSGAVDPDRVAFVMISVDGERDTPAVLEEFLGRISPRFTGVTGETAKLKSMAAEFRAAFFKNAASGENYTVSHSPQVFVIDPNGRLRAEFYSASLEAMAGVTRALLDETASSDASGAAARQ